jgi:hypothetical protein
MEKHYEPITPYNVAAWALVQAFHAKLGDEETGKLIDKIVMPQEPWHEPHGGIAFVKYCRRNGWLK